METDLIPPPDHLTQSLTTPDPQPTAPRSADSDAQAPESDAAPKTISVVGVDMSKTRELVVKVKYDKVIPKRFHVEVELTSSLAKAGGGRGKVASRSFIVAANSFESVYRTLPGLIQSAVTPRA